LMETGVGRRRRRAWLPIAVLRRNAVAVACGVVLALAPAGVAAIATSAAGLHSWSAVGGSAGLLHADPTPIAFAPAGHQQQQPANGTTVAAAGLVGVVGVLALMLALVVVSFVSFFLLGIPAVVAVIVGGVVWGIQVGFGGSGALQPWLAGAGGVALLALALNTGAALPIYWSLVFGSGRRLDRLREAWSNYWALFRGLVIPACALFGVVVFRLLATG
jgi:hypothetical protein